MKTAVQFHSHLAFGREILAESATFLPVEPDNLRATGNIFTPAVRHSGGFLPILNFNRKNLTVAQPLLKGGLR